MPSKRTDRIPLTLLLGVMLCAWLAPAQPASLSTLFTTPQERQIINSNRYRDEKPKPVEIEPEEVKIELSMQPLEQEEVVREYRISGITLSQDGPHSVWINSVLYQDGEELEDGSRLQVQVGDEIRVRITAPDGRHYYATSGQALEISYLVTVRN